MAGGIRGVAVAMGWRGLAGVGSELCEMNFSPVLAYMSFKLQFAAVFHFLLRNLR